MMAHILSLVVVLVTILHIRAIPTEEKKERVYDKPLSDVEHDSDGEHNPDYDHDAFLGHEEAKTFDQLTPDESRARLGIIVDKIDKNQDGEVTEQELKEWIQHVQFKYITTDTERMWRDHSPDADNTLSWESYMKRTFGYAEDPVEGSPTFQYKKMIDRDRRRWTKADSDDDKKLTKDEFQNFLHPEEMEHMRSIVVDETLEDIDKDGDGYISLDEYIADLWPRNPEEVNQGEPDWIQSERRQFGQYRDKNNDGVMDRDEVKHWIMPDDYDHSVAESRHLVFESDVNKDGKLTKEEIVDKYDLFVGSQATDFGAALTKHDEF